MAQNAHTGSIQEPCGYQDMIRCSVSEGNMKSVKRDTGKKQLIPVLFCLSLLLSGLVNCTGSSSSSPDLVVLARVEVPAFLEDLNLPVYADLEDGNEIYYALVLATRTQLDRSGVDYRVIDENSTGADYVIATEVEEDARARAGVYLPVLYDDGRHIIARYESRLSEVLPDLGFELKIMSATPINFNATETAARVQATAAMTKNLVVEAMMDNITEAKLEEDLKRFSGIKPIVVDGAEYTLTTRNTSSGEPLQKATKYVYERLKGLGLKTVYENWSLRGYENRNVVGEITGKVASDEIIVLIAHLDSVNDNEENATAPAPGADDNASGCVGLLAAAEVMSTHEFRRTIRFVLTTGEEQGTLGSQDSAERARKSNEKIMAVINLDMIAYTKEAKPRMQVKTRNFKNRGGYTIDKVIADTCLDVIRVYGLDSAMTAVFEDDGEVNSDHASFWDKKYAAIWLIEYAEKGYLNPDMHSTDDVVEILNKPFLDAMVSASMGTAAHLAGVIK